MGSHPAALVVKEKLQFDLSGRLRRFSAATSDGNMKPHLFWETL